MEMVKDRQHSSSRPTAGPGGDSGGGATAGNFAAATELPDPETQAPPQQVCPEPYMLSCMPLAATCLPRKKES